MEGLRKGQVLKEVTEMRCVFVGGRYDGQVMDVTDVEKFCSGHTEDLSEVRARGGLVHRAELDNQPEVKGYCGPMWDGGCLRYETWDVYDMLSR